MSNAAELDALQSRVDRIEREHAAHDDARVEAGEVRAHVRRVRAVWDALTPENQGRSIRAIVELFVVDEATGSVKMRLADLASADVPRMGESE